MKQSSKQAQIEYEQLWKQLETEYKAKNYLQVCIYANQINKRNKLNQFINQSMHMKIHEFYSTPDKWCKHQYLIRKDGDIFSFTAPPLIDEVQACCLSGAVKLLYGRAEKFDEIEKLIMDKQPNYIEWNDRPETTFQDIKNLVVELDI